MGMCWRYGDCGRNPWDFGDVKDLIRKIRWNLRFHGTVEYAAKSCCIANAKL